MPALLYDRASPETLTLPLTPYTDNLRQAKVDLERFLLQSPREAAALLVEAFPLV